MAQNRRGCGCLLAVLSLAAIAAGIGYFKFYRPQGPQLPRASGGVLQVHILNVGQGDAILIIAPGGKSALVDAGDANAAKTVRDALNHYGVQQLDLFVASHPHPDHIGGASELFKSIKVANVLDSGIPPPDFQTDTAIPEQKTKGKTKPPPKTRAIVQLPTTKIYTEFQAAVKQSGAQLTAATPGQRYELGGGVLLTVLAPIPPPFTKEQLRGGGNEPNANSIVLRLDYGDFSMLLPADAEAQTEQRLLSDNANLAAKILKVAHHGSKYATTDEFLRRVKPATVIISVGEFNRYGQPAQPVLDRLKAAGVKVFRTDLQGEITISSKGDDKPEITAQQETRSDLYLGRADQKDDSARSGFIAYGDFGPPPKQPKKANVPK